MTPRNRATAATLAARRKGYCVGMTTSHWPHEYRPGEKGPGPPLELELELEGNQIVAGLIG